MERSSFLSPTEKRSGAPDPGSAKRFKTQQAPQLLPLAVPSGHAVFRLLCRVSQVGALIGKSGNVIKQLQLSTGAKIRVEEAPPESPDRVITVVAPADVTSRVKLGEKNGSDGEEEESTEVSKAQEAIIRVFEVLVGGGVGSGTVSCRLLTEASHAGAVIGKGGKMVEKIRKETGCKISILTENLPVCADPDDEMVEIEGNVLAVKKALVSVSRCLQDCQPINKTRMVGNRSLDRVPHETSHRPTDTIVHDALRRPVEVTPRDFRLRSIDMHSQGTLLRPIGVIPQDALRRCVEVVPQDALHRPIIPQDALYRPMDVIPRDPLNRPIDLVSRDVLHWHREAEPHDALQRPIEMVRHDALDRPFELFPQDSLLRRIETIPQETLPELSVDSLSDRNSALNTPPCGAFTSATNAHLTSIRSSTSELKSGNQEVVFKILCSTHSAGGLIGKGGNVIRALHSETGASINVGNTLPDCDERLITVTASENPEDQNSPAQKAIILVFSRLLEIASEKGKDNGSRSSITARLVVPTNQVGCLLGKGGSIVSEMRKTTATAMQVLKAEQNPKCVSENDQVMQISGEFPNVKEAIYHVTTRLRDNLFSNSSKSTGTRSSASTITERNPHGKSDDPVSLGSHPSFSHSLAMSTSLHGRSEDSLLNRSSPSVNYSKTIGTNPHIRPEDSFPDRFHPSASYSPGLGRLSTLDHIGLPHHLDQTASHSWASKPATVPRGLSDASGGLSSARAGLLLGSGSKSAVVTNTTVEIRVPESAMNFVYGEDGQNLEKLRKISGARVIVHEPHIGTSDRIIVISGTPDQTQTAQNLLHAFILTGETSSLKSYSLS